MKRLKIILKRVLLAAGILSANVYAEPINPHAVFANEMAECTSCHRLQPEYKEQLSTKYTPVDLSKFKLDGVEMCTPCHSKAAGHMVGVMVDFPIPSDLPLSAEKAVSCLTCHYTHGSLLSDRPQASYSFMDSLLNSERLHKSFLIRRNNVNGELCLTCHNTQ